MESIKEIYSKYAKTVYKYFLIHTNNVDLAEEFTQETFSELLSVLTNTRETAVLAHGFVALLKMYGMSTYAARKKQILKTTLIN